MLEIFLNNKKKSIIFLNNILKLSIADIEFVGIEHFETIVEYKFSVLRIKLKYGSNKEKEIFLRGIKAGKIKESVFCFCSLLYEELRKNKTINDFNAIITQKDTEEYISKIFLNLNKLNYSAEINLVELKEYAYKNYRKERWVEELGIKSEDILFIGII